jgi:aprataxin
MPPPSSSSSSSPPLKVLRTYAKLDDASLLATLPPTVYFSHTRHTLTIFDAYPKALFHFLILPRLHVSVRSAASTAAAAATTTTTTLTEEGDGDERREYDSEMKVADTAADLTSLRTLLQRASASSSSNTKDKDEDSDALERAQGTLSVLSDEATRLQSQIEREMCAHYGFKWPIWIGFHAVPSME